MYHAGEEIATSGAKKKRKTAPAPGGSGRERRTVSLWEKTLKRFAISRVRGIVRNVNCNGGRFAWQRGKSGLHRAGSPSSRRMSRGQPRGKESATENRPPGVFGRPARVKRRCKRPPGAGAIRPAWQAPSGARPNRGRCRCPRRYQSRVLAA